VKGKMKNVLISLNKINYSKNNYSPILLLRHFLNKSGENTKNPNSVSFETGIP